MLVAWSLVGSCASYADPPEQETAVPHRFESEIAAFEKYDRHNAFPKKPVLFVGSSSVRLWKTADAFPDLPVINRGFGGSTIADVNHFFDRVVRKYHPKAIVFYSGDNDIAGGKSPQQVFADFKAFISKVHDQLPDTRVIVFSIKPSIARNKLWPKMQEVNTEIRKLAGTDPKLEFVDIAKPMLSQGDPPPSHLFMNDGLHLSATGYKLWNDALRPRLQVD